MTAINGQLNESENTFFFFNLEGSNWQNMYLHPFFTADSQSVSIFQNFFISAIAMDSAAQ